MSKTRTSAPAPVSSDIRSSVSMALLPHSVKPQPLFMLPKAPSNSRTSSSESKAASPSSETSTFSNQQSDDSNENRFGPESADENQEETPDTQLLEFDDASSHDESQDPNWFEYEDVLIHVLSFHSGLTVIKPAGATEDHYNGKSSPTPHDYEDKNHNAETKHSQEEAILLKNRQIYFSKPDTQPSGAIEKAFNLLQEMNRFAKSRRGIYMTNDLASAALFSQNDYVLLVKSYQLELHTKNAAGNLIKISIERDKLQQILQACGVIESLKRKLPCRLELSRHALDAFENCLLAFRKSQLLISTETDLSNVPANYHFVLNKKGKMIKLFCKTEAGAFKEVNMKPNELQTFLANLNLESKETTADEAKISLNTYQLEKLEQLSSLSSRSLFVDSCPPVQGSETRTHYYISYTAAAHEKTISLAGIKEKNTYKRGNALQLQLYSKNSVGQFIKANISALKLKGLMTELGLIEKINRQSQQEISLSVEQTARLDSAIKLHVATSAYNAKRTDEAYVSLPEVGLYTQPWLSTRTNANETRPALTGFKRFHTVGCLFGSTLKGVDKYERKFPMIKHDCFFRHNLKEEEKIASVSFNHKAANPYEAMLFTELKRIAKFINIYADRSNEAEKPVLTYHIPHLDYVLFGLSLLAINSISRDSHGNVSFDVLESLFIKTFHQKNKHIAEIKKVFSHAGIQVQFESPFENLFNAELLEKEFRNTMTKPSSKDKPAKFAFTRAILKMLGILDTSSENSSRTLAVTTKNEKELTEHLLHLLTTNNYKPQHKQLWTDFIAATHKLHIKETTRLTELANKAKALTCAEEKFEIDATSIKALYQSTIGLIKDKELKKGYEALYTSVLKTPTSLKLINLFYDNSRRTQIEYSIRHLSQQILPHAVSQFEKTKLSDLLDTALQHPTASNIDALLEFGTNNLQVDSIDELFRIGNSALLGYATTAHQSEYAVCSILPASEKQIQVHYDHLIDNLAESKEPASKESTYRSIVNITFLPTAICAEQTNKQNAGLFFYYGGDQAESIARVIQTLREASDTNLLLNTLERSQQYGDISGQRVTLQAALTILDSPQMGGTKPSFENDANDGFSLANTMMQRNTN